MRVDQDVVKHPCKGSLLAGTYHPCKSQWPDCMYLAATHSNQDALSHMALSHMACVTI